MKKRYTKWMVPLLLAVTITAGCGNATAAKENMDSTSQDMTIATEDTTKDGQGTTATETDTTAEATTEAGQVAADSDQAVAGAVQSAGGSGMGSGYDNGAATEAPTVKYWVNTVEEVGAAQNEKNYLGVRIYNTPVTIYNVYSDGSRDVAYEETRQVVDASGYSATDDQLKTFAQGNYSSHYGYYQRVLELTNEIRAEEGIAPLVLDNTLCLAATMRSVELDLGDYFAHTRADGSNCFTVFSAVNYSSNMKGENIAAGRSSPEAVVAAWKASPGHYLNMVNSEFTKLGVGFSNYGVGTWGNYWTQLFSS